LMSSTGGERLHQWKSDPQRFACGSAAGVESKTSYRCAGGPGPRQVLSATAAGRAWDLVRSGAANAFEALIRNADQEAVVATPIASITVRTRLSAGGNRIRTIGPASGRVVDAKFQRSDPGRSNTDFWRRYSVFLEGRDIELSVSSNDIRTSPLGSTTISGGGTDGSNSLPSIGESVSAVPR